MRPTSVALDPPVVVWAPAVAVVRALTDPVGCVVVAVVVPWTPKATKTACPAEEAARAAVVEVMVPVPVTTDPEMGEVVLAPLKGSDSVTHLDDDESVIVPRLLDGVSEPVARYQ